MSASIGVERLGERVRRVAIGVRRGVGVADLGQPQSSPSTTPSSAAFSVAAAARYGLAVPHGMRFSMRVAAPRSAGTRYVLKRLSRPQLAQ